MSRTYPEDFVTSFPGVTESDIEFGRTYGLIKPNEAAKLSHLFPVERMRADVWTDHHLVWRTIALKWALENCKNDDRCLFDEVDSIYAEFNYPEDMKNIVSYMPGDNSSSYHTLRERIIGFYQAQWVSLRETRSVADSDDSH